MRATIPEPEYLRVLTQWRGARAALWCYHISHKRAVLSLERAGETEALFVLAIGCERLSGPVRWANAEITIITGAPNEFGEVFRRVIDTRSGFEMECSDVSLAKGPQWIPRDCMDGFFGP